ncbi:MAG: alpha/beta fold hydrolase [Oscillochloridaceae bacterium umkhey_bin13]
MSQRQTSLYRATHQVSLGQVTLSYQTIGVGPPVVLIHGLLGSGRWWRHNLAALATHFQLHLIDLVGFGASCGGQRFVLRDAAAQIAAWMDRVDLPRATLIGHSMGGLIAAEVAAAYPARIERLVLVNAATTPLGRNYLRHACGLLGIVPALRPSFLSVLVSDTLRAGPRTMLQAITQLLAADATARLAAIEAPTLLVWGGRDTLIPLRVAEALTTQLRSARLVLIPAAGHNPMWEQPNAFNQAVLAFLCERA